MELSKNLIKQFVSVTNDSGAARKQTTAYGTIVIRDGSLYARLDGSQELTPIIATVDVKDGERVLVNIRNHNAMVTSNLSDPSAGQWRVDEMGNLITDKCVTFESLQDGSTTIHGGCIKTGKIAAERLELTGEITWSDLDSDAQGKVNDATTTAASAAQSAATAYNVAVAANGNANAASNAAANAMSSLSNWTYPGTTKINGQMIQTGTVSASFLQGGVIYVYGYDGNVYGIMYAGTNSGGNTAFEVYGYNGLRLVTNGNAWLKCSGAGHVTCEGSNVFIGTLLNLQSEPVITSDRNRKHDIEYELDKYDVLFDALRPCRFKYNDGESDRYHTGLIAQDVKDAILAAGLTTQDFAGYCDVPIYKKDENENPTEEIIDWTCSLRNGELIPLLIRQVQQLKSTVRNQEERIAKLEALVLKTGSDM